MPMYLCLPCVKGGGGVAAGGIVTKVRNNPSGAPAPAPLAQGSRISHNSVGRGLAPAAFVRELLFLPPSVREVSPNGDGRSFEQSKNSPSHLSVTAPSPRGLKKSADFTLAAKKNRPNGFPFGLRFFYSPQYAMPWAIIAVATFTKPAMFAPATRLPFMPYFSAAS